MLALIQLMQWRDKANGCKLKEWCNWSNEDQSKYTICSYNDRITAGIDLFTNKILTFKTSEIRDQFMKDHKDLLNQAKILL